MSLFKVRDFWTFDLDALQLQTGGATTTGEQSDADSHGQEGNFTASVGRFTSIGHQDVFVCGNLQGALYIIQVPVADQRKYIKETTGEQGNATAGSSSSERISTAGDFGSASSCLSFDDRQLLAATSLNLPIVDLKCGHFISAMKQTVAVLSFDKLLILQVRRHKVADLLTGSSQFERIDQAGAELPQQRKIVNDNLLSHEFEECLRLDLLAHEFACNLVVLNSHTGSSLSEGGNGAAGSKRDAIKEAGPDGLTSNKHGEDGRKFAKRSKQVVQQLHLPQRDKLIVQYVNQFLITLIDSKKITGHFSMLEQATQATPAKASGLESDSRSSNHNDSKMQQMSQSVGCMPMAYLHGNKASSSSPSLILSFSDHGIHSIPLDRLISLAKQDIMKRVALDLLHSDLASESVVSERPSNLASLESEDLSTRSAKRSGGVIINVAIETVSEWSHELISMPLHMSSPQRRARSVMATSHNKDELTISQLLVMSRYAFDLFTACGQHLWSQRFETPLIHSFSYVIDSNEANDENGALAKSVVTLDGGKQRVQFKDNLISLLCADSLAAGKSDLIILIEDQISWSALLNTKPFKIWRLNLAHMPGLLALLDIKQGQLIVSYLGTNLDGTNPDDDDQLAQESGPASFSDITKLELLNELSTLGDNTEHSSEKQKDQILEQQRKRLSLEVSLDASGKWPNVCVDMCASVQLVANSTGVIHNITAILRYDDLLGFNLTTQTEDEPHTKTESLSFPSQGAARIELGNCWPDRREPIRMRGTFSLLSSSRNSFGVTALDELEMSREHTRLQDVDSQKLIPKSLGVQVLLSYNETHSSLLVQEESFLLPVSMISQLTHVDYTNGAGQNLDDVLANLDRKRTSRSDHLSSHFCDIFLELSCDLVGLLDEFVERDLVCRSSSVNRRNSRRDGDKLEAQVETLENINLLAQSLDCRLRYKNPAGMARQSSEEFIVPAMVSFGLRFDCTYKTVQNLSPSEAAAREETTDDCIVWVHVFDLTSKESHIAEQLIVRHMKEWMRYSNLSETPPKTTGHHSANVEPTAKLLISIECDRPLPLIFVLDHLLERAKRLSNLDTKTTCLLMRSNEYETYEDFCATNKNGHRLAISSALHDSLRLIVRAHKLHHQDRFVQLGEELDREYCKYYIATTALLSLLKRLPSLPQCMSEHLKGMSALVKNCQKTITKILNDLCLLKGADYQFSKVPHAPAIKIRSANDREPEQEWPNFERVID